MEGEPRWKAREILFWPVEDATLYRVAGLARGRIREMDAVDRLTGHRRPQECPVVEHLRAVLAALGMAILMNDGNGAAEAFALGQYLEVRLRDPHSFHELRQRMDEEER